MNESKGPDPEAYRQLAKDIRLNEWLWLIAAPAALLGLELTAVYPDVTGCIVIHWLCWFACAVSIICAAIRSRLIAIIYDERAELLEARRAGDSAAIKAAEDKSESKVNWNKNLSVLQVTSLCFAIVLFVVGYVAVFPKATVSSQEPKGQQP